MYPSTNQRTLGCPGRLRVVIAMLLAAFVVPCQVPASDADQAVDEARLPKRKRIALVLGGGGARGAAHVGVLEVLEELRIPVDVVIGTSMGAIVGGFYAAGYSPAELKQVFSEIDWNEMFDDRPERKDLPFRRKEDDLLPLFESEVGIGREGVSSSTGSVAGRKLGFLLQSLSMPVMDIGNFDDLPIPFRAVAVDINTAELVVMDHGPLATAIRASMSFPGAFTPVEFEGRMLVDGGVLSNLSIDVAREFNVDRIIAVDVGSPFKETDGADSMMKVIKRAIGSMTTRLRAQELEHLGEDDLLIMPPLEGIKAFKDGFEKIDEAIEGGVEAARAVESRLREFSVSEEDYERFQAAHRRRSTDSPAKRRIDEIEIAGLVRVDVRLVTGHMRTQAGEELDLDVLEEDLERIYEIGAFENVGFHVVREGQHSKLLIEVIEKHWGPNYMRIGAGIEADFQGTGDVTMLAQYRRTSVNRLGAEWRTVVGFGDVDFLVSEFYQPLDFGGNFFVAPRVGFSSDEEPFLLGRGNTVILDTNKWIGGLDIGFQVRNHLEIRAGAMKGRLAAGVQLAGVDDESFDLGGWQSRVRLDTFDHATFPRHGWLADAQLLLSRDQLGADNEYDWLDASVAKAWAFGRHTILGSADVGSSLSTELPFHDWFKLGGFLNLSGLRRDELFGDRRALGRLMYYRKTASLNKMFGDDVFVGASLEAGNVWFDAEENGFDDLIIAGSLFVGLDSWFGPMYLAYGVAETGDSSFYFFLGRFF